MTVASSIAPSGGFLLSATTISSQAALPLSDSPTTAVVTNLGEQPIFVALGASSSVAATTSSLPVMPKQQVALTIGANTNIAVVTMAGVSGANVTVGS